MAEKQINEFKKKNNIFNPNDLINFKNINLEQIKDIKLSKRNEDIQVGTYHRMCMFGRNRHYAKQWYNM